MPSASPPRHSILRHSLHKLTAARRPQSLLSRRTARPREAGTAGSSRLQSSRLRHSGKRRARRSCRHRRPGRTSSRCFRPGAAAAPIHGPMRGESVSLRDARRAEPLVTFYNRISSPAERRRRGGRQRQVAPHSIRADCAHDSIVMVRRHGCSSAPPAAGRVGFRGCAPLDGVAVRAWRCRGATSEGKGRSAAEARTAATLELAPGCLLLARAGCPSRWEPRLRRLRRARRLLRCARKLCRRPFCRARPGRRRRRLPPALRPALEGRLGGIYPRGPATVLLRAASRPCLPAPPAGQARRGEQPAKRLNVSARARF